MKRVMILFSFLLLLAACGPRLRDSASRTDPGADVAATSTPIASTQPAAAADAPTPVAAHPALPTPIGGGPGQIAFAAPDGVHYMNTDGTGRTRLPGSIGHWVRPFAWSPDGRKLAFMCAGGICVRDFEGLPLTCPDQGFGLAWSPDGKRIAFITVQPYYELHVMNADCSQPIRLAKVGGEPAWSPDSRKIAFWAPTRGIFVVNADGNGLTQVILEADGPAWSPDGQQIAYAWYADGGIHVIDAERRRRVRLASKASGEAYLLQPSWSPDGTQIAYAPARLTASRLRLLNTELFVMNADGSEQRRLAPILGRRFSWSPDGTLIAVSAELGGQAGIYLVAADGSAEVIQLTSNVGSYPTWRP